jgi:hypothetical protein
MEGRIHAARVARANVGSSPDDHVETEGDRAGEQQRDSDVLRRLMSELVAGKGSQPAGADEHGHRDLERPESRFPHLARPYYQAPDGLVGARSTPPANYDL